MKKIFILSILLSMLCGNESGYIFDGYKIKQIKSQKNNIITIKNKTNLNVIIELKGNTAFLHNGTVNGYKCKQNKFEYLTIIINSLNEIFTLEINCGQKIILEEYRYKKEE